MSGTGTASSSVYGLEAMTASSFSVVQRLVPSVARALGHRAVPAVATLAALLALCWTLAQGTSRVLQPASAGVVRAGGADLTDLRALANAQLFGRSAPSRSPAAEASV